MPLVSGSLKYKYTMKATRSMKNIMKTQPHRAFWRGGNPSWTEKFASQLAVAAMDTPFREAPTVNNSGATAHGTELEQTHVLTAMTKTQNC